MDGVFSRDKFEYVWRNISMDSSLLDEEFDNTVGDGGDGEFEVEGIEVETVEEEEDDSDDDNSSDDNEEVIQQTEVNNDDDNEVVAETVEEETDDNNSNDDDGVDYKTITEEDDEEEAEREKWYYKAKFMLDWVNNFRRCTVSIRVLLLALMR